MTKEFVEVLPRIGSRSDDSYIDFVKSLRSNIMDDHPKYAVGLESALTQLRERTGNPLDTFPTQKPILDELPAVQLRSRLMRSQQEMKGVRIERAMEADREALLAELERYQDQGPATLELDPNFDRPAYTNVEFHIQHGGYQGDDLSGFGYHYGTRVFFRGEDDEDELHARLVATVPEPDNGKVESVLDLACSLGQSTTALKDRFANAKVWGIDQSEPMLRAAHRRACMVDSDVVFAQRLVEKTKFQDQKFDVVYSFILFHELPVRIIQETVREIGRLLRPGGVFVAFDFMRLKDMDVAKRYHRWFDARHNGEPYSEDFCAMDFDAELAGAGLRIAKSGSHGDLQHWITIRKEDDR